MLHAPMAVGPWLHRASPLLKLAVWAAFTLFATLAVQAVAWLLRLQPEFIGDSAKHLLLPIALISLIALA
ncbi:MAG: hypothetical protein HZB38_10090, partial [Planctomycetes bacterium]|nr:hypothetical protein [Planctomycetota bacterium]